MNWKWFAYNGAYALAHDVLLFHLMKVEHNFLVDDVH
jgi:hypothetical protein